MRTDAILFTKNGANTTKKSSYRMDRMQDQNKNDSDMGFGTEKASASTPCFKETYAKIAKSNTEARQTTDSSINKKNVSRKNITGKSNCTDNKNATFEHKRLNEEKCSDVNETTSSKEELERDETDNNEHQSKTEQASDVIKQALMEISDTLQLNSASELNNLSLGDISDETVSQLAQVVHELKTVISALSIAASSDQSIDTGKEVIESSDVKNLLSKLKSGLFKIELGINNLGKSEDVQNELANKSDQVFSTGIPQATDPSTLGMPADQVKKMFSEIFDGSENDTSLSQLLQKINGLFKNNNGEVVKNGNNKEKIVSDLTQKTGSDLQLATTSDEKQNTIAVTPVNGKKTITDVTQFDSQTFRKMLNIESKEKVQSENVDAGSKTEKFDLPQTSDLATAKDISNSADKHIEQVVSLSEITAKIQNVQPNIQDIKTPLHLTKTIEQSVVSQLSDKIHVAVRSGITEVRVQLRPEALGEVSLKIRIEGDVVTAKMQVENQQVKAIVENNFSSLKDALAQHNLQAGSLEVNVQSGGKQTDSQDGQFFANNSSEKNADSSENNDLLDENSFVENEISKSETGRRFGNNTVEYFG